MNPPGLFDGSFMHQHSVSLGGDRMGEHPTRFQWLRNERGKDVTFYTDQCLDFAVTDRGRKVAWLIEPPSLHDSHYRRAIELEANFDYILTFDTRLLERGDQWLYYPCGGSWIKPDCWGLHAKTRDVSIIVSEKMGAEGHLLRRAIWDRFGDRLDGYGRGIRPIPSKLAALQPYRYSIVVESIRMDGYFTEKLIDCISVGTAPIYWGDPGISDHFDPGGMLTFQALEDLDGILGEIRQRNVYARLYPSMVDNLFTARDYQCAEDWIWQSYDWLFRGKDD